MPHDDLSSGFKVPFGFAGLSCCSIRIHGPWSDLFSDGSNQFSRWSTGQDCGRTPAAKQFFKRPDLSKPMSISLKPLAALPHANCSGTSMWSSYVQFGPFCMPTLTSQPSSQSRIQVPKGGSGLFLRPSGGNAMDFGCTHSNHLSEPRYNFTTR